MVAPELEPIEEVREADVPVVLCVDDERPILSALVRTLRHEPCRVVVTEDPEEALHLIRTGSVRLILADYRMAAMSGTSLLQVAKAASPSTIRVMLTGYPEDDWVRTAAENGLMEVWRKPWNDQDLRAMIRERLRPAGEARES
jgi:DNA-binding NtrC family response regulator